MKIGFLDFDMYSKRVGFFYNNKEKVGTPIGVFLTILYIISSLSIFIFFFNDIIKRKTIRVHDSTIYPRETPSIHLDEKLFYFAFGVEAPTGTTRFIDNTIYYPKVHFFDKMKDGGNLKTVSEEELKIERCNETKFGEEYQNLLVNGELNNSFCIKNINLTLIGGFKYDRISYIRIGIYPCVNTTDNNNHCKPQEVIDAHLSGAYFSLLAKDIGLNPSNYNNPTIPTFQNLYTTIDKTFFRDFILYFGITEIQTDEGLFKENIKTKNILQFRKESQAFYFRDESNYYEGKTMCAIQFRLGDDIRVQKRSYNKITEVFAATGGYMQLISTVFTIITLCTNKLGYQIKLVNSLFNFYPKKRKIMVKSEFSKLIDSLNNNTLVFNPNNFKFSKTDISRSMNKTMFNNINKISLEDKENDKNKQDNSQYNKACLNVNSSSNFYDSKVSKLNNNSINEGNIYNNSDKRMISKIEEDKNINNRSKIALLPYGINIYSSNLNKNLYLKQKTEIKHNAFAFTIEKRNQTLENNFKINIFYYYCFSNCKRNKDDIKLFNEGISFYRKKMDIIHLFNIILLIDKIASNQEKNINNK